MAHWIWPHVNVNVRPTQRVLIAKNVFLLLKIPNFQNKMFLFLVNCSNLPPCPYSSSLSCLAVDVPLECPQLCGLCDRYEILKSIYGPENLSPDALAVKSSSHLFSFSNQMFVCCIIFILINKIPSQKQNKTWFV